MATSIDTVCFINIEISIESQQHEYKRHFSLQSEIDKLDIASLLRRRPLRSITVCEFFSLLIQMMSIEDEMLHQTCQLMKLVSSLDI